MRPTTQELSTDLRGRKVRILWAQDMQYYQGRILGKSKESDHQHMVQYDDGDLMSHDLSKEITQLEEDDGTGLKELEKMENNTHVNDADEEDEEEDEDEDEEDEMEDEMEEQEEEDNDGMIWSKGDLVQCLAPNSRWYRATVEAVRAKSKQYDILYERSNTKEKYVNAERVMEYIKFKDRSKKGTPRVRRDSTKKASQQESEMEETGEEEDSEEEDSESSEEEEEESEEDEVEEEEEEGEEEGEEEVEEGQKGEVDQPDRKKRRTVSKTKKKITTKKSVQKMKKNVPKKETSASKKKEDRSSRRSRMAALSMAAQKVRLLVCT